MKYRNRIIAVLMGTTMALSSVLPVMASDNNVAVTTVENLEVGYQSEAMGVETEQNVRFSWNMQSNLIGQSQVVYQIDVTDAATGENVFSTGKVESDKSTGIECSIEGLKKEKRYNWTVTVDTKDGQTITSEPASFVTDTDMSSASWIMPVQESGNAPLLRTEKKLSGKVKSAYLYMSALGTYTAYINGTEVTAKGKDDIFAPGWTDYKYYTNYQTYDVTDLVTGEDMVLGVQLGNGWYAGEIGDDGGYGVCIGDEDSTELALIGRMVINYEDGSQDVVETNDRDWISSDYSAVVENDFFNGETYDANIAKEISDWNTTEYDTSDWSGVTVGTYTGELRSGTKAMAYVADQYELTPVSAFTYNDAETISKKQAENDYGAVTKHEVDVTGDISLKAGDKLIVDMGQNAAGAVKFTVSGEKDTVVKMTHAEMLNDGKANPDIDEGGSDGPEGSMYMKAITNAEVTDRYILSDDEEQTFSPTLTYHGYRYVQFEANADVTIKNISGKVFTGVGEKTGTLETSNSDINQLVSNTDWSQMSNYVSIPTDCPQRGERAGWTGDAQLFAATGVYNYDVYSFLENYNDVMQEHAAENENTYGSIMPSAFVGFFAQLAASGWSDAGIIIPWVLYQQTGDTTLIQKYYEQMNAYMDKIATDGYDESMFGDWLGMAPASTPYLNAVYQIYTTQIMKKMADVIGNTEMSEKYQSSYDALKAAFLEKYVDAEGNVLSQSADGVDESNHGYKFVDNAQTALLWALKCELYENDDQRNTMIENLITNIKNEGGSVREGMDENTLSVGFLGVNVILPVLTEIGAADVAYDLLLQDAMPSWLYSVKNGSTTIWERWNSYSTENSFGDPSMNSFNHYSYGACLEWMYKYMCGIEIDEAAPGFKHIILQPTVDASGRIEYANGSYDSLYGEIVSDWTSKDGVLDTYHVEIPANTTATLYLPVDEAAASAMPETAGIAFKGMNTNNGETVAEFTLESGCYDFQMTDGAITSSLAEGYLAQ